MTKWISERLMGFLNELKDKYNISTEDFDKLIKMINEDIQANVDVTKMHYEDILEEYDVDEDLEESEYEYSCFKCGKPIKPNDEVVFTQDWDAYCHLKCCPAYCVTELKPECRFCHIYQYFIERSVGYVYGV